MIDILLKNAIIVDGAGTPAYRGDEAQWADMRAFLKSAGIRKVYVGGILAYENGALTGARGALTAAARVRYDIIL